MMKIVSWNVNGIRSLKPGIKEILADLNGDVVCLQETKLIRSQLEETTAFIDGYTSYFSFPRHISGYSGVATYCKNSCKPIYAEEGFLGLLNSETFNQCPLKDYFQLSELQQLENEGRVMITEHLLRYEKEEKLAIINVYCPRADPDRPERKEYKLKFYQILQYRTEEYLKKNYHVIIIIGDMNTAHRPIDHCDPGNIQEFSEEPARKWLDSFLCEAVSLMESTEGEQNGLMVDTFRYFNPNQKDAYTCWNSRTSARAINCGTRIDYVLTNRAFLPFVKDSIVLPEVQGSDHCPVAVTIHCTPVAAEHTPKICTRNWPEFAGKQQTLLGFLKSDSTQPDNVNNYSSAQLINKKQQGLKVQKPITLFLINNKKQACRENEDSMKKKPRILSNKNIYSSFGDDTMQQCSQSDTTLITSINNCKMKSQDNNCPHSLYSDCSENPVSEQSSWNETSDFKQKQIWKTLLSGPPPPPLCKGHNEPCVLRTVKRDGVNYGRQFFTCSKPSGPSTNPNSSCNHFEWVKSSRKMPERR